MPIARVTVEIEWAPTASDLEKIYDGDAPVDFAWRSFERLIRPELDHVAQGVRQLHYHILSAPKILPDAD